MAPLLADLLIAILHPCRLYDILLLILRYGFGAKNGGVMTNSEGMECRTGEEPILDGMLPFLYTHPAVFTLA